jgi:hypothetical protein
MSVARSIRLLAGTAILVAAAAHPQAGPQDVMFVQKPLESARVLLGGRKLRSGTCLTRDDAGGLPTVGVDEYARARPRRGRG